MARQGPLAIVSIVSAAVNLGLSIALVSRLGLEGVALGTLIPTAAEVFFVVPYTMHVFGISIVQVLAEIYRPALLPLVPMGIVLTALQQAVSLSSAVMIVLVAGAGMLVYVIAYLMVGTSAYERQIYRGFALAAIRFTRARLARSP
jgi:O-antigen/teichoic acid export membrane protein